MRAQQEKRETAPAPTERMGSLMISLNNNSVTKNKAGIKMCDNAEKKANVPAISKSLAMIVSGKYANNCKPNWDSPARIFLYLWQNADRYTSASELAEQLYITEASASASISRLRKRLASTALGIENRRGYGYRVIVRANHDNG